MPNRVRKSEKLQNFFKFLMILCPVFTFSAFFCVFSPIAHAYTSYELNGLQSNISLQCDNNGVYVTSFSGNKLEINYILDTGISKRTLTLEGEVKSVTTNNGVIYAISATDNTIYLNRYIYNRDTLNCFIIETDSINPQYKFAVAGDRLYFAEDHHFNQIACHSITGEKIYSFYVNMVTDYRSDNNGTLYICNNTQIFTVDTTYNSQPQCKLSNTSIRDDIFVFDNIVYDFGGNIINMQTGLLTPTNISSFKLNGTAINGYYCKYSAGKIYGYTENGDSGILCNISAGENAQLCGFNDKLYILSDQNELFIISENELEFPQNSTAPSTTYTSPTTPSVPTLQNNQSTNNNSSNNQSNSVNNQSYSFSINNYYIDKSSNIIWNIPNSTTISTFKNNLTYSGYTLEFYDSNQVKKASGQIGTGFTMVVKDKTHEHSKYTMSVNGDLSGDGNITRTDVTLLSEHLMSSTTLTSEQYASADTNGDNVVNGVDILKIARNNL